MVLLNPNFMQKIRKKVMSSSLENSVTEGQMDGQIYRAEVRGP